MCRRRVWVCRGAQRVERGESWVHTAAGKSQKPPQQDPLAVPWTSLGSPRPWGPWDPTSPSVGFHKETTRLSWEEGEWSLSPPDLSFYRWNLPPHPHQPYGYEVSYSRIWPQRLARFFFFFNVWRYWLKWLSLSPPQIICFCPSVCQRLGFCIWFPLTWLSPASHSDPGRLGLLKGLPLCHG